MTAERRFKELMESIQKQVDDRSYDAEWTEDPMSKQALDEFGKGVVSREIMYLLCEVLEKLEDG